MLTPDKQLQTILFADIAGSTRLYEKLGDAPARALVAACVNKLARHTRENGGMVIKTIGDEVMSAFDTPDQAVSAAIRMQEALTDDQEMAARHIQLHIGLHHGPVIVEADDMFGDAVNTAAGMVDQAKAGQILTSDATLKLLAGPHHAAARLVDQTRVKGKWRPTKIFEITWGHPGEQTLTTSVDEQIPAAPPHRETRMALAFQDRTFQVGPACPVVALGRDPANTLIVNDPKVSRWHARIELRKDKFLLVDQSTNGTYVQREDGQTALLRRDELTLPEAGVIGLGQNPSSGATHVIRFNCLPPERD